MKGDVITGVARGAMAESGLSKRGETQAFCLEEVSKWA